MAEGASGDIFDPRRLRKLWERKPETDEFEERERREEELRETEPVLIALDLFEEIVRTCRRKLGARFTPLEPLLKEARGLLAMQLAAEGAAVPSPPPPAEPAPAAPAAPGAAPEEPTMRQNVMRDAAAVLGQQSMVHNQIKRELNRAMRIAGLDKAKQKKPEPSPAELATTFDNIEDLISVLSSGSA